MKNMIPATNRKSIHILYQEVRRSRRFDEASAIDDLVFLAFQPTTCAANVCPQDLAENHRRWLSTSIRKYQHSGLPRSFCSRGALCTNTMLDFHFSLHRPGLGRLEAKGYI